MLHWFLELTERLSSHGPISYMGYFEGQKQVLKETHRAGSGRLRAQELRRLGIGVCYRLQYIQQSGISMNLILLGSYGGLHMASWLTQSLINADQLHPHPFHCLLEAEGGGAKSSSSLRTWLVPLATASILRRSQAQ